ncbi:MAG: thioesterase family protein [Pseudomonadota bacterium]
MNLFFRLVFMFIQAFSSKERIGMLDEAKRSYRVWLTDQDMFAHMTNSRYLSFGDLGTLNYIIRSGFWSGLRKNGWFPVVCGQTMVISKMLKTPQKFDVVTNVVGWDSTYVGLRHRFMRGDKQHAEVRVVARFAGGKGGVSTETVLDAMPFHYDSPDFPPEFLELISTVEAARPKKRT